MFSLLRVFYFGNIPDPVCEGSYSSRSSEKLQNTNSESAGDITLASRYVYADVTIRVFVSYG